MGVFTEPQVAQQWQPWQEHLRAGGAKAVSNVTLCPGWYPALLLNVAVGTPGERWRRSSWVLTVLQLGTLWSNSSVSPANVCTTPSTRHSLGAAEPGCPGEDHPAHHSIQLPTGPLNGTGNTSPSLLETSQSLATDSGNDLTLS